MEFRGLGVRKPQFCEGKGKLKFLLGTVGFEKDVYFDLSFPVVGLNDPTRFSKSAVCFEVRDDECEVQEVRWLAKSFIDGCSAPVGYHGSSVLRHHWMHRL